MSRQVTVSVPEHIFEVVNNFPFSAEDGVNHLLALGYEAFKSQPQVQEKPVIEFADEPTPKKGKKAPRVAELAETPEEAAAIKAEIDAKSEMPFDHAGADGPTVE